MTFTQLRKLRICECSTIMYLCPQLNKSLHILRGSDNGIAGGWRWFMTTVVLVQRIINPGNTARKK